MLRLIYKKLTNIIFNFKNFLIEYKLDKKFLNKS